MPAIQNVAKLAGNIRFMPPVFIIAILIAEDRIISNRTLRVTSVQLFGKDFLLADILELALIVVLFDTPIPHAREALHVDGDRPHHHDSKDIAVFLEEAAIAVSTHSADAMTLESANRVLTSGGSLKHLRELDSLAGAAEVFRTLEAGVRTLNAQIAEVFHISGAVERTMFLKALEGKGFAELVNIHGTEFRIAGLKLEIDLKGRVNPRKGLRRFGVPAAETQSLSHQHGHQGHYKNQWKSAS